MIHAKNREALGASCFTILSVKPFFLYIFSMEKQLLRKNREARIAQSNTSQAVLRQAFHLDGWMDDLRFYVLFNSSGDRTRSARLVGQRLTHLATGAPVPFRVSVLNILLHLCAAEFQAVAPKSKGTVTKWLFA